MAELSDLPLAHRLFLAGYRFRALNPVPFVTPRRPLAEARLALVTTAGLSLRDEEPFDPGARGGDTSFRVISSETDVATLVENQRSESFDHSGLTADRNLGFPLERLREMAARGVIGALNHRHLSFMGAITAPGRLVKVTAPAAADLLVADGVDVALLVPL